jgi:hypothetical protein
VFGVPIGASGKINPAPEKDDAIKKDTTKVLEDSSCYTIFTF